MRSLTLLALAALTFTTGCHGVDSTDVDTEDIEAHLVISTDGRGEADVVAELKPIGHSLAFVELVPGEALRVSARGIEATLHDRWLDYHAELPVDRPGTEYQIRLDRQFGTQAPDSFVEMPPGFELYRLPGVYSVDYDIIPIQWDRIADDKMKVTIEGPCISDFERTLTPFRDGGEMIVYPGQLYPRSDWDGSICELEVKAERIRQGRLDRHFADGGIIAKQVREMRLYVEW